MDYEKKYKEALVNMQELYNSMKYMSSTDALHTTMYLEKAFPELRESKDEKIRKYLLKLAERCPDDSIDFMHEVKKENIISWLEKQGEQKPTDEEMKILLQTEYEKGKADAIEQKFAWSEEDNGHVQIISDIIEDKKDEQLNYMGIKVLNNEIAWLKSLKERMKGE